MNDCVILRYGETGLKSKKKRAFFEKLYVDALKEALLRNDIKDFTINNLGGRFILENVDGNFAATIVKNVPGVQSVSPSIKIDFVTKDDLIKNITEISKTIVKDKTFKIAVRRIGEHDFSSMPLAGEIGDSIFSYSKGVSMKSPDVTINIEIRKNAAYLYTKNIEGIGGLPPKSAGKFLCLFSGGIDSPVAAYNVIKRGAKADFLFINLVGDKVLYDVAQIYNFLCSKYVYGYEPRLYVVDARELVEKIKTDVEDKIRQIALKIVFYKLAENIAKQNKYWALVTGETLSQKSSQTVESLSVIQSQISTLVIRPLITTDKAEIMKMARIVGTMAASEKIAEYCNLSEGPVTTTPRMEVLSKIPTYDEEIISAVTGMKVYTGFADIEPFCRPDINSISDFNVIWLSSKESPAGASIFKYPEILHHLDEFTEKNYLIVCDYGIMSEGVASLLRKKGKNAIGIGVREFRGIGSCSVCKY